MKKFLFECGTRESVASTGLLVMRVCIGLMMLIGHGWGKIEKFGNPEIKNAWLVPDLPLLSLMSSPISMAMTIFAEVGCAAMLVLGLMTRPAAFFLGFAMLVAAFQQHGADPFFMGGGGGGVGEAVDGFSLPVAVGAGFRLVGFGLFQVYVDAGFELAGELML